jgi:GNAT superfamily N-acetyltransferase
MDGGKTLDESAMVAAMESGITVREATSDDAARISELLIGLAEEFIVGEFSAEGRRHLLSHLGVAEMAVRLASEDYRFQVAERETALIGVVGVRGRTHLQYLFVSKLHQRAGLARRLWDLAREQSGNASGRFTVNASSYAVPAYQRLGFASVGGRLEKDGVRFQPMEWVEGT